MKIFNRMLFGTCIVCFVATLLLPNTSATVATNPATTSTTAATSPTTTAVATTTTASAPTSRAYQYDPQGWTLVAPAGPSIYLDPGHGIDTNTGSETAPLKTFAAAYRRSKSGGAILIARGTTLIENLPGSVLVPGLTIGAYGPVNPRPGKS